jgi:CheY-like chemotaxis protein
LPEWLPEPVPIGRVGGNKRVNAEEQAVSIQTGPILIVEDIVQVRELLEMQLQLKGYRVEGASDGQEALALIEAERPAVIVSDILMPRMDGFALAHALRKDPQTAAIPIVFLSATYVSAEDERFALNLGALRFLPKPVDADQLFLAVADSLTGQARPTPAMSERDFYVGYRQRLEIKLRQKAQQIGRNQQQMQNLPPEQRETYRRLVAEAQSQYDAIQAELTTLTAMLQDTP